MAALTLAELAAGARARLTAKSRGLVELAAAGAPVPEALVLDGPLDGGALAAVRAFIGAVDAAGHAPLFSIRSDAKRGVVRPPPSVLNVGLRSIDRARFAERWAARSHAPVPWSALERVLDARTGDGPRAACATIFAEVEAWLRWLDARVPSENVVVQRMVFGCCDERSGNGIACNLPGPPDPSRRFRGVFLPRQQGIGLERGTWGSVDLELDALASINPRAWDELARVFDLLESRYGPDRYLEFTAEGERLFVLQHERRTRAVGVGLAG